MRHFLLALLLSGTLQAQTVSDKQLPSRTETIAPLHKDKFCEDSLRNSRKQGGNPQTKDGNLLFTGSTDGNRQVDPQIAVGGGYVLHGTNNGLIIYTKKGEFVAGISQKHFNNGIDPKMGYEIHNKVFLFDLWWYYDKEKTKPVNISVSETSDPTAAWNTYPVPAPNGVDGGGIGYSKKWIGYSFPGGEERTFVLKLAEAKSGKPATIYHFAGSLGHPVAMQDNMDDLYFFEIAGPNFIIRKVTEGADGIPYCVVVSKKPHQLQYYNYPPQSSQKGTAQKVSSGDRNPKNLVYQNGSLWFSHAVNKKGHSAVQWHQIKGDDGTILQTGIISSDTSNYIQTTLAVNKRNDVLIGFQEVNGASFISPRLAYRYAKDAAGTVREMVKLGEGKGAADGVAWGDYSGSVIDGDNMLDLWTIQSIANEKGRGETVIVKVPFTKKQKKKRK